VEENQGVTSLRRSGLGVGGIAYTMADMSFEKMAVWNWPAALS